MRHHYIAAAICLVCASHAHAASIEVGAGIAQTQTHGNGIWYQEGFAHTLNLHSSSALRATYKF
jgi:hypothetical protein